MSSNNFNNIHNNSTVPSSVNPIIDPFSDETSSVSFSGESFNSCAHSSLRNCPFTAAENYMAEKHRFNTDPEQMPLRLPGVPLHLGYLPLDESDAFAGLCETDESPVDKLTRWSNIYQSILVYRCEEWTAERLANLIYKFIYCQEGIVQVPNHGEIIPVPTTSMYYSRVKFSTVYEQTVYLTLQLGAVKMLGENYFEITAGMPKGSDSMHRLVLERLREYILSGGTVFRKIVPRDLVDEDEDQEIAGNTGFTKIPRPPILQRWTGLEEEPYFPTTDEPFIFVRTDEDK